MRAGERGGGRLTISSLSFGFGRHVSQTGASLALLSIASQRCAASYSRVHKETATGSVSSERVRLTLQLIIGDTRLGSCSLADAFGRNSARFAPLVALRTDNIDFEPEACTLRLKGRNQTETPHVKLGASHTLDLEVNRDVTLHKHEWDDVSLQR